MKLLQNNFSKQRYAFIPDYDRILQKLSSVQNVFAGYMPYAMAVSMPKGEMLFEAQERLALLDVLSH